MKLPIESILVLNGFLFFVGILALSTGAVTNATGVLMLIVGGFSVQASLQLLAERKQRAET